MMQSCCLWAELQSLIATPPLCICGKHTTPVNPSLFQIDSKRGNGHKHGHRPKLATLKGLASFDEPRGPHEIGSDTLYFADVTRFRVPSRHRHPNPKMTEVPVIQGGPKWVLGSSRPIDDIDGQKVWKSGGKASRTDFDLVGGIVLTLCHPIGQETPIIAGFLSVFNQYSLTLNWG